LTLPELDTLADRLADFYLAAPRDDVAYPDHRAHLVREIERDRAACADYAGEFDPAALTPLFAMHHQFLDVLIAPRVAQGRLVEGHGDLRPQHVCLLHPPVAFDCVEFNRRLRIVDPVAELAFLAMECELLDGASIGERLLDRYAARTGDSPHAALVDYYKSRSASVRARLCLLHTRELGRDSWARWIRPAHRYLRLARNYADRVSAQAGGC
jgi:aminoglycoside phosphotransferase family enzyme